jgi:hypothetical protein
MGVGGQRHAPTALPPGKTPYPLYRRLGRPQSLSGMVQKVLPSLAFDPRTVQSVASRYSDPCVICVDAKVRKITVVEK